jgi:hypothetical protein
MGHLYLSARDSAFADRARIGSGQIRPVRKMTVYSFIIEKYDTEALPRESLCVAICGIMLTG